MKVADSMLSRQVDLLLAAPADEPVLADMFQLYAREFSAFHLVEFGADGRFVYRDLRNYWVDPYKHAYFIQVDGTAAGFVLIQQTRSMTTGHLVWEVAEFFILGDYRRRGIGLETARRVWNRFPGSWQIRVLHANDAAFHFWDEAVLRFTGNRAQPSDLDRGGDCWRVFSFESLPTG